MDKPSLAHSPSRSGRTDTVTGHLQAVARRAAEYAAAFGAAAEARLAGLLHDFGKYGELFQRRLRGEAEHVDHWSAGAWHALAAYHAEGLAAALAVQGHHIGLQRAEQDALRALAPDVVRRRHPLNLRLSEPPVSLLAELQLPARSELPKSLYAHGSTHHAAAMLDIRMLFSCLVDADFIETEAHFNAANDKKVYRPAGPRLDPAHALGILLAHVRELARKANADPEVNTLRADLLKACLDKAVSRPGRFTLTAPTGSGKTLAMLAFALKHAAEHDLQRVVLVIPYLSIIEQTAHVYRTVFEERMGPGYVLEHHSLAGTRGEDDGAEGVGEAQRLQAENWDAPIVVTTSVQFLESLFSNRPSACRKLHRLAGSVVLFDEVQTLPTGLAILTLATLSRLVERYHTTVVFATATQPAFTHLDKHVKEWCSSGWRPAEIVPREHKLYDRARRTRVEWPEQGKRIDWPEVACQLAAREFRQALCVVNLKRHAVALFAELRKAGLPDGELFHLSTNMCPAHRAVVLAEVRRRLSNGEPCRLVSTQCVEAGVDLDFPVVFRAWGPLDSIAQAAGRCNRHGLLAEPGRVRVFVPRDDSYPGGPYKQAAGVASILAASRELDLDSPELYDAYYRQLYDISRPEERNQELQDAIRRRDFVDVARLYRVIEEDAVSVLVPYDKDLFEKLTKDARAEGLTRTWIARARPYAVSLYRPEHSQAIRDLIVPLPAGRGEWSDEWYEYVGDAADYDPKTGLTVAGPAERLLIA